MQRMGRSIAIAGSMGVILLIFLFSQFKVTAQETAPSPTASLTQIWNPTTTSLQETATLSPTVNAPGAKSSPEFTHTVTPSATPVPPGISDDTEPTATFTSSATSAIPTETGVGEVQDTPIPSLTPTIPHLSFPLIIHQPTVTPSPTPTLVPVQKLLVCRSPNLAIPDNNTAGVSDTINIGDGRWVQDLDIRLDLNHSWVGDLVVNLTHISTGTTINLLSRPGNGCNQNNVKAILDDEAILSGNSQCVQNTLALSPPAIGGIFKPLQALSGLDTLRADGGWRLNVADYQSNDTGTLRSWCIYTQVGSPLPATPTPPPPPGLPDRARVSGAVSFPQSLPLDCESRVAVDYASFFKVYIRELDFYNNLPHSDNPDRGFVGDVNGLWGQIPPNPYGVHAEPVAALLRQYGVSAYAHRKMSWETLRSEIAAGKPVFVWDVGSVDNGFPTYYTPSDGNTTIVANYQHVVQVVGYDIPANQVNIIDNGSAYTVTIASFQRSWSALDNMAIISHP